MSGLGSAGLRLSAFTGFRVSGLSVQGLGFRRYGV